jgi:DNA repair protein SbcC/Rad50
MRLETVHAYSFGPLSDVTLEFGPGMTVIYGGNESGKSSWHAAVYVSVCGMRRARGRPTAEDEQFASLHKPWDGHRWEVGAVIRLEDGRRVELRHDLAGRVDSRATDIELGRDVSGEIMDGMPDASRWLGLDRRSFLATACVQQTDLLGILAKPELLQEHLQRAAATAGTDATAAAAISRLEGFRAEHVGADIPQSKRPLREAKRRVESAELALRKAKEAHHTFVDLAAHADRARKRADDLEHELRLVEAAAAVEQAQKMKTRLQRAQELSRRFSEGPPPALTEDDEVARMVAQALQSWEHQPASISLMSPSAQDLQRQLDALPLPPEGDLEPHPDVLVGCQATLRRFSRIRMRESR